MTRRGLGAGSKPLLVLVVFLAAAVVAGLAHSGHPANGSRPTAPRASSPPVAGRTGAVVRSIDAVEQAFNRGNARLLCRRDGLVDSAVIAAQDRAGSCESELEVLMGEGPMRLSVSRVSLRSDIATVTVSTAHSARVPVDLSSETAGVGC